MVARPVPATLRPATLVALQRMAGNGAVGELLRGRQNVRARPIIQRQAEGDDDEPEAPSSTGSRPAVAVVEPPEVDGATAPAGPDADEPPAELLELLKPDAEGAAGMLGPGGDGAAAEMPPTSAEGGSPTLGDDKEASVKTTGPKAAGEEVPKEPVEAPKLPVVEAKPLLEEAGVKPEPAAEDGAPPAAGAGEVGGTTSEAEPEVGGTAGAAGAVGGGTSGGGTSGGGTSGGGTSGEGPGIGGTADTELQPETSVGEPTGPDVTVGADAGGAAGSAVPGVDVPGPVGGAVGGAGGAAADEAKDEAAGQDVEEELGGAGGEAGGGASPGTGAGGAAPGGGSAGSGGVGGSGGGGAGGAGGAGGGGPATEPPGPTELPPATNPAAVGFAVWAHAETAQVKRQIDTTTWLAERVGGVRLLERGETAARQMGRLANRGIDQLLGLVKRLGTALRNGVAEVAGRAHVMVAKVQLKVLKMRIEAIRLMRNIRSAVDSIRRPIRAMIRRVESAAASGGVIGAATQALLAILRPIIAAARSLIALVRSRLATLWTRVRRDLEFIISRARIDVTARIADFVALARSFLNSAFDRLETGVRQGLTRLRRKVESLVAAAMDVVAAGGNASRQAVAAATRHLEPAIRTLIARIQVHALASGSATDPDVRDAEARAVGVANTLFIRLGLKIDALMRRSVLAEVRIGAAIRRVANRIPGVERRVTAEVERVRDDAFEAFDGVVTHVDATKDVVFDTIETVKDEADALVRDMLDEGESDVRSLEETVGRRSQ
jgi:hypothetical protein